MSLATRPSRRLRSLVGGTAATAALVTGLAACGSSTSSDAGSSSSAPAASSSPLTGLAPDQAVRTAFTNLGHASTVHTQLKLDTSPGAAADMTKGSGAMTSSQAALLQNGTVDFTVTAPQGEDVDQAITQPLNRQGDHTPAIDFSLNNGGAGPVAAIRTVAGNLYATADLSQLSQVAGTNLTKDASQLGAHNPSLAPITSALLAGKWLELSSGALGSLGKTLGSTSGPSGMGANLPGDFEAAFTKDVTWKAGTTSGTYDASLDARSFIADLYPDMAEMSQLSGNPLPSKSAVLAQIPAGTTVSAVVATADDQVSSVTIDLLQFDHNPADLKELGPNPKVDLVTSFDSTSSPVTAPTGAVTLDKQIPSLMMGLMGMAGANRV